MSGFAGIWQLGPRITAQVLGLPFAQYRPTDPLNPLANKISAALPVWITADPALEAVRPFRREKPDEAYAAVDPALTRRGDYLVGSIVQGDPTMTFFVASQDLPAPIRVVACFHALTFAHQQAASTYSGQLALGTPYMAGWPAAMVQGTKGETGPVKLPGDVRAPWFTALLPSFPGVMIRENDIAKDENGVRYIVSSPELTALGWRLTLSYAGS